MPRFYLENLLEIGSTITITSSSDNHKFLGPLTRPGARTASVLAHLQVLRLQVGDEIVLFNGTGYDYQAQIKAINKRSAVVELIGESLVQNESPLELTLLIALLNSNKFELVLQKAAELGVHKIVPLLTERTQRMAVARTDAKYQHWQKVIISASEQCGRAVLADLAEPTELQQIFAYDIVAGESVEKSAAKFILSPHHAQSLPAPATCFKQVSLMVGPEGGFTEAEVSMALEAGCLSLTLGPRILRAETAAIAGISYLQHNYGDFGKR